MLQRDRQAQIIRLLHERGFIKSGELAKYFSVSDMTIRRDLEKCEQNEWIQRCYGGAVLTVNKKRELEFEQRRSANMGVKKHLALTCAGLVQEGMSVFLGPGTTIYEIAQQLRGFQRITVYTNDIQIAHNLLSSSVELHIIGGLVQKYTGRIGGQSALQALWNQTFDLAFCSTGAIDSDLDVVTGTAEKANFKRLVRKNADACYLVADHTKFHREDRHKVLPLGKYTGVVTNNEFTAEEEAQIREKGIHIVPGAPVVDPFRSYPYEANRNKTAAIG